MKVLPCVRAVLLLAALLAVLPARAQDVEGQAPSRSYDGPIIDVHLQAYTDADFYGPAPNPGAGELSPGSAREHMERSIEMMRQHNVVFGVPSGHAMASTEAWHAFAEEKADIFYNNAAGFLGLNEGTIARHHATANGRSPERPAQRGDEN